MAPMLQLINMLAPSWRILNVSILDPLLPTFLIATLCLCALCIITYYSLAVAWEVFWASWQSPLPLDPSTEVVLIPATTSSRWQLPPLKQQLQLLLDCIKLTSKRKWAATGDKGGMVAYHINSSQCLCSATSLGHVLKCSSNVTIRERRFATLFSTVAVSWESCQRAIVRWELWTNCAISTECRDTPQDDFERTELYKDAAVHTTVKRNTKWLEPLLISSIPQLSTTRNILELCTLKLSCSQWKQDPYLHCD